MHGFTTALMKCTLRRLAGSAACSVATTMEHHTILVVLACVCALGMLPQGLANCKLSPCRIKEETPTAQACKTYEYC